MMSHRKAPLYQTVYQDLFEKINNGYYSQGDLIPTEEQLCEAYGVSRVTVRKACDLLVKDDLVERTPGFGTVVKRKYWMQKSLDQKGFTEEMISHGIKPTTKVLDFSVKKANAQIASILGINEGEYIYYFQRARYGDGEIYQMEITHMSSELFPDLSLKYLEGSKFEFVESHGYKIDFAFHQTSPVLPPDDIAELFEIDSNTPILKIDNTTFLTNGKVMDYTIQYMNSPKYQLRYIRKKR